MRKPRIDVGHRRAILETTERARTTNPMKPQPKRTTTQQGLGKVTAETRRATERARFAIDDPPPTESARGARPASAPPPISAPPPSGRAASDESVGPRHTREIASAPPAARQTRGLESNPPKSQPIERVEQGAASDRVERSVDRSSSRAPIDVTHVDTDRLPKQASTKSASARPADRFEGDEKSTGTRRTTAAPKGDGSRTVDNGPRGPRRPVSAGPVSGRPVSGRPVSAGRSSAPSSNRPGNRASVKPPSHRPNRNSTPPAPSGNAAVARSRRPSIREDDVGAALNRAPAAIEASTRVVPRLVRSKAEIAAAPIDHRAGFLLAHIDGVTSVQGLVDIAGMAENEVHEILDRLRRLGIVAIR